MVGIYAFSLIFSLIAGIANTAPALADEYERVCSKALMEKSEQRKSYCAAAKTAKEGVKVNGMLSKVWSGVAAVCFYDCAAQAPKMLCTGANVAAGGAEAIATKNLGSIFGSLIGVGMTQAVSGTMKVGPLKLDKGACLAAAAATFQVISKSKAAKSNREQLEEALRAAQELQGSGTSVNAVAQLPGSSNHASGGMSGSPTGGYGGSLGKSSESATACNQAAKGGALSMQVSCALAHDKNLPSFVSSKSFGTQFEKAAGFPFEEFSERGAEGAQGLASAMSGGLSSDQSRTLAAVLNAAESAWNGDTSVSGSAYAGGGGGGDSGSAGGDEPSLDQMLQGFMGQLNPQEKKEEPRGDDQLAFGGHRGLAAAAEDRTISIFDRVHHRYHVVKDRMISPSQVSEMRQ